MSDDRFHCTTYLIRKKVLKLLGGAFHIYGPSGDLVLYSKQAFKLKEDIRLYTGEDMREEVLIILARQVVDFSSAYDVIDARTRQKVGALKRKGLKSILRDEWIIMDAHDRDLGRIQEDSVGRALLRRLLTNLVPQAYHATLGSKTVCTYRQMFNPFVLKVAVDFTPDTAQVLDRRLGLAAGVLLCAIEGRQG